MKTKTKVSLWLLNLALLVLLPGTLAAEDDDARVERGGFVQSEILVKFKQGTPPGQIVAAARGVGAAHKRSFASIGVRHWRLGKGVDVDTALRRLSKRKHVEFAEPNYVVTAHDLPDDPRRGDLWGLHNIGQSGGAGDADIDAPEGWDLATDASSVVVGIIDSGIDYAHEDLAANMWVNPGEIADNGIDDDGNGIIDDVHGANFVGDGVPTGDPMDDYGHGTHTAGTVGAVGNNATGVTGVCWNVKLMALKFLNAGGRGTTADAIEAVEYAASFGVRVTNNSWGGGHRSKALQNAIDAAGALFVASAGNSGSSRKQYPAGYSSSNVISVAATDHDDVLASFSNYGSGWVDLAAPGVNTLSCEPNDEYGSKSGTSMSAPHVAGAAALVIAHTGGSNAAVRDALLDSVDLLPGLADLVATGGRLNLFVALGGTVPPTPGDTVAPSPVTDLATDSIAPTASSVTLTFTASGDDGQAGTAALYDVRRSASAITDLNWDSATLLTGEPLPQSPGSPELFVVTGLDPETTYHFAMRVFDEAGNGSTVSNGVSAATPAAPPGAWTTEILDTSGGFYKGLDFHGGAGPFRVGCAHSDADDTVVALLWDGTQWLRELVGSTNAGPGVDFAFAPDGTPTVSYGWGKILFGKRDAGGSWIVEKIENGRANNDYTALVYDPSTGEPTVAYRKGGDLRFARKVGGLGGTWSVETVEQAGARYQSMVYDKDGNPVIAYSDDPDGDGWLSALKVATWNGSGWDIVTLHEGVQGYGVYVSITVDDAGTLMAADAGYGHIIAFRKPAGGTWGAAEAVAEGGSIDAVFDQAGVPYISYSSGGETHVAFDDGTGWKTELVDAKSHARTDIDRDPDGNLGLLYGRQGGGVGLGRK